MAPGQLKGLPAVQALYGVAILIITPLIALALHRIKKLAIKLNESF